MVGVNQKRETESSESMAFPPDRSRPLHNFNLPALRWGHQRHLRCMKINGTQQPNFNPGSEAPPSTIKTHHRSSLLNSPPSRNDDDGGIEAIREKVMSDLRDAADRMKFSMLEDKEKRPKQNQKNQQQLMPVPAAANANANEPNSNSASARPCNLRTRRAACKEPPPPPPVAPVDESPRRANGGSNPSNKPPDSPVVTRLRGLAAAANNARQSLERGEGSQKPKFSIELTREEIEHDFLMMTGKKPPRRPKKRTRNAQKKVDSCFPGLWLSSDVTVDSYNVPDPSDSSGKA